MIWDPKKTNWYHHNFTSCLMITSTQYKHHIQILRSRTQWTAYKTNKYKYDDPFVNERTYLFSHGGVDIHPENLSPNIKTCKESITMASTYDEKNSETSNNSFNENTNNNKSILSMHDLVILHANNIFSQNRKDDFKSYKHLHDIAMQIHYIPKPLKKSPRYGII
jgi:hypothetical protein